MSPGELLGHRWRPGQLIIGKLGDQFLGHLDDRPIMTIAGTRAGKTSTILEPNLYLYGGSMLVLDPKGELSRAASYRRAMGHNVYVLDPFGPTSASYNPVDELDPNDPAIIDDVLSIANAIVPEGPGEGNAKFFNDNARTVIVGLILLTLTFPKAERHLVTVRQLLSLTYKPLLDEARIEAGNRLLANASEEGRRKHFSENGQVLELLFQKMARLGNRFGGVASGIGKRLQEAHPGERANTLATALVHTDFLDSLPLRKTLQHSDFSLATLRADKPATIFLCLPVGRMEQHFRWFRLIVQLACTTLEKMGSYPIGKPPIVFMLEEFPILGTLKIAESAAAYLPSFGILAWYISQDVNQIRSNYRTWSSFLGNAGLVQLFANGDSETLEYVTKRLGKLITPWELELAFAREHEGQVLLKKGLPPAAAMRLSHDDVERIRENPELFVRGAGWPR
jgi:type IV secretion system protein VirD4